MRFRRAKEELTQEITSREAIRRKRTPAVFAVAAVCALGLAFNIWLAVQNKPALGIDFNQFYAASHLAGTGHLYDWDALRKLELENGIEVPTGRLPVVLYGYKILGSLPYRAARSIWMAGSIAALIVFVVAWRGAQGPLMALAVAYSMPATLALLYGQDVPFWLMFFGIGVLLLAKKKPWSAGLVFSLCICKFHLALGIPIMLAAQKRWRTLIAGGLGVLALFAGSFLIEGRNWPFQYLKVLKMPGFSPAPERMPNLHGIASWLPWAAGAEIAGAVAIVLLLWWACRGSTDLGMSAAAAAACGLLLANHAYAGDCAILLPLTVLTIQREGVPSGLKVWAVLLLSPAPVLFLVSQKPYLGQVLIVAFVVTAILVGRKTPLRQAVEPPVNDLPTEK